MVAIGKGTRYKQGLSVRSPLVWYGGKSHIVDWILSMMPAHGTYVEVFGGGASVLLHKLPPGLEPDEWITLLLAKRGKGESRAEIYNDVDAGLYSFFMCMGADDEIYLRFRKRVEYLLHSRKLWNECYKGEDSWDKHGDLVERAWRWFYMASQSFSGKANSFAIEIDKDTRAKAWQGRLALLEAVHRRLRRVLVENQDWRECLRTYDRPGTLFYLDPPYYPATLQNDTPYAMMTAADHEELLTTCLGLQGMVLLSGYANPAYARLEANGWQRDDHETTAWSKGITRNNPEVNRPKRTESLWRNPAALVKGQLGMDLSGNGYNEDEVSDDVG